MANARDAWLDNIKAVLVTFVVTGHFIASGVSRIPEFAILSNFIYSFHMPAFLFVSGYLMKRRIQERAYAKIAKTVILPYCVSQIFIFVFAALFPDGARALSAEKMTDGGFFSLLYPIYHLWYFVAVALGFLFCVLINTEKHPLAALVVSAVVSIAAGFYGNAELLRLTKCLGYLPFLVLGAIMPKKALEFIKTKRILKLPAIICTAVTAVFLWLIRGKGGITTILAMTGRFGDYFGMSAAEAALARLGFLAWGSVLSFSVMALCPRRKNFFTYIGENSIYVFVLHAIIIAVIRHLNYGSKFIYGLTEPLTQILFILLSFAVSALLAVKPVRAAFKWLADPYGIFCRLKTKIIKTNDE